MTFYYMIVLYFAFTFRLIWNINQTTENFKEFFRNRIILLYFWLPVERIFWSLLFVVATNMREETAYTVFNFFFLLYTKSCFSFNLLNRYDAEKNKK